MNIRKMPTIPTLPRKKQVDAYARVSSGKDAMLHSLSAQISYYSEYIQKQPEWLYCDVYVDEAVTGTKSERSKFQHLLSDCRAGKIDMIITKSVSRFARNTVTLLETVRELKSHGIDVYFEEPNIHTMSWEEHGKRVFQRLFICREIEKQLALWYNRHMSEREG